MLDEELEDDREYRAVELEDDVPVWLDVEEDDIEISTVLDVEVDSDFELLDDDSDKEVDDDSD